MLSFEVKFTGQYYQLSLLSCLRGEFIGRVYEASFRVACYKMNLLVIFMDEVYKSNLRVVTVGRTLQSQIF